MTNFFERQSQARRKTKIFLCYFMPAVVLTILAVCVVVALCLRPEPLALLTGGHGRHNRAFLTEHYQHNSQVYLWAGAATLLLIVGGSLYKMRELALGGSVIATMLGGRPIKLQPTDPEEKRLRDIVEEMSIASGVPVPEIYILREEKGINAFVAGHDPDDAALGVTEGAIKLLNRDELQAVIGHEFSHLLSGDMRLNLWMIGLLHGILCISLLGKVIFRIGTESRSTDSRRRGGLLWLVVLGAGLVVVGSVGYFCGRLIKAAVCRQREHLADAASVQFTRNPMALACALKKVGGLFLGSRVNAAGAEEVAHLFFGNILGDSWTKLMATHPPLAERIRLLDPTFDGKFPKVESLPLTDGQLDAFMAAELGGRSRKDTSSMLSAEQTDWPSPSTPPLPVIQAEAVFQEIRITPRHVEYAAELRCSFSDEIRAAAHEPFGASALVYAMLLSNDEAARQQQLQEVRNLVEQPLMDQALKFLPAVSQLTSGQKMALMNLALPALRQMAAVQFNRLGLAVQRLAESDREISLFEYTMQKIVRRQLESHFKAVRPPMVQYYAINRLLPDCAVLLTALAYYGANGSQGQMEHAFEVGAVLLDPERGSLNLLPPEQCNLLQVDAALEKLKQASLPIKRQVLHACAIVVAHDGVVQEMEAELLRSIADALGCPLPPFVREVGV